MDATGVGSVMYEQLQVEVTNLQGFTFTTTSKPPLIMALIKSVDNGSVKFNDVTANELSVFEYKISSSGHVQYRAQSGFHDDCVMALAMGNQHRSQAVLSSSLQLYSA